MISLIVAWIFSTPCHLIYMEDVKDLWVENRPHVQELKAALANYQQQGSLVLTYYSRLKWLCDELSNYKKVSGCCCRKKGCTQITDMQKE